jgi:hypothetical protein
MAPEEQNPQQEPSQPTPPEQPQPPRLNPSAEEQRGAPLPRQTRVRYEWKVPGAGQHKASEN